MRRLTIGMLTVVVLTLAVVIVHQIAQAQPAAPGTYYKTYAGTDFSPLESDDVVRFAPNTGGGVWMSDHGNIVSSPFLEVRVDLPSGAQVTEVAFYVRACADFIRPILYFGAYIPATNGYAYIVPQFKAPQGECGQTQTITQPVNPSVTIDNATRAYVVGYIPGGMYDTLTYSAAVEELLVGARVTFQMPGAFLPSVLR